MTFGQVRGCRAAICINRACDRRAGASPVLVSALSSALLVAWRSSRLPLSLPRCPPAPETPSFSHSPSLRTHSPFLPTSELGCCLSTVKGAGGSGTIPGLQRKGMLSFYLALGGSGALLLSPHIPAAALAGPSLSGRFLFQAHAGCWWNSGPAGVEPRSLFPC